MKNVKLFKKLSRLVVEVRANQGQTHHDFNHSVFGSSICGLTIEKCLINLAGFITNDETRRELKQLRSKFSEAGLNNYVFASNISDEKVMAYENGYQLGYLEALADPEGQRVSLADTKKNWKAIRVKMDDELFMDAQLDDMAPGTPMDFLARYLDLHLRKYGKEFNYE